MLSTHLETSIHTEFLDHYLAFTRNLPFIVSTAIARSLFSSSMLSSPDVRFILGNGHKLDELYFKHISICLAQRNRGCIILQADIEL